MGIFTWRQRAIVYLTNFIVIGLGAAFGVLADVLLIKNGRYWGAAVGAIFAFPFAVWLTISLLRGSIKPRLQI